MRFVPFMTYYDTKFEGWPAKGSTAALMRFVPFTVHYDTEFEGWPEKGSTAALSHSE
jgi:hypothetical protein